MQQFRGARAAELCLVVNQEDFQVAHGEGEPRQARAPGREYRPGCNLGDRTLF
jgi:hypothetical protein